MQDDGELERMVLFQLMIWVVMLSYWAVIVVVNG